MQLIKNTSPHFIVAHYHTEEKGLLIEYDDDTMSEVRSFLKLGGYNAIKVLRKEEELDAQIFRDAQLTTLRATTAQAEKAVKHADVALWIAAIAAAGSIAAVIEALIK